MRFIEDTNKTNEDMYQRFGDWLAKLIKIQYGATKLQLGDLFF